MRKAKPVIVHSEGKEPGWYWVRTALHHRTPYKRWIILELIYDPESSAGDEEDDYFWMDPHSDEFDGNIVEVGKRIHEPENKSKFGPT